MLDVLGYFSDITFTDKFARFDPTHKEFTEIEFPSLTYFRSSSPSLLERNIELLEAIKKDVKSLIFKRTFALIPPATQTKIVEGEVDFSLFQKDFIKKAVQLSEEQYLQNHSILSKLKLEYGPDIFAKVFEKESKEQKNDILLGAVDLTSKESLIFELADHHLKFELAFKLQFDHVDFFYPLIEEFSDAIIDETLSSLSLKALKELVKYPDLVPLQLEKFHTQAKECTFLRNKKLIAKLSENFSSSAVRKAIVAILTPKELEKAQLGLFAIEKKNSELMTYLDCFLGDFDLRTLDSTLKFNPEDLRNKTEAPSTNFRVFKWSVGGSASKIDIGLSSRHGSTSNLFLGDKTPKMVSENLSRCGFRSMISLSDHDIEEVNRLWFAHGPDHTRICHPVVDYSIIDFDTIKPLYAYVLDSAEKGRNILINCGEGFGRSGLVMAGLLIYSYYEELKKTPNLLREILSKKCSRAEIKTESKTIVDTTTTVKFAIDSIRIGDQKRGVSVETEEQIVALEQIEKTIRENLLSTL